MTVVGSKVATTCFLSVDTSSVLSLFVSLSTCLQDAKSVTCCTSVYLFFIIKNAKKPTKSKTKKAVDTAYMNLVFQVERAQFLLGSDADSDEVDDAPIR